MFELNDLEKRIGYVFKNKILLKTALTHKSYAHERKEMSILSNNERLEFLGDAILEHVISIYLYNISPEMKEGVMTKKRAELVCEKSLSSAAKQHKIDKYIKLGKCEINTGGNKKDALIADMLEAILGAIYIDGGYDEASKVCLMLLKENIEKVLNEESSQDYKTTLQEILQKNGNVKITYVLDNEEGKEHSKTFYSSVYYENEKLGEGCGKTKKESEQMAAKKAIKKLQ